MGRVEGKGVYPPVMAFLRFFRNGGLTMSSPLSSVQILRALSFSMAASCSLHRGQISRNQKRRQKTATTAKNKLESLGSTPRLEHAQGDGFLFRVHINESHDVHFCQLRQRSSSRQGRSKVRMERKRKKERKKKEKKKKERERKTERQPGRWVGASRAGPPCPFGVFQ